MYRVFFFAYPAYEKEKSVSVLFVVWWLVLCLDVCGSGGVLGVCVACCQMIKQALKFATAMPLSHCKRFQLSGKLVMSAKVKPVSVPFVWPSPELGEVRLLEESKRVFKSL